MIFEYKISKGTAFFDLFCFISVLNVQVIRYSLLFSGIFLRSGSSYLALW